MERTDRRQGNLNDKIIYLVLTILYLSLSRSLSLSPNRTARPRLVGKPVRCCLSFSMYCKCNQKYRSVLCKLTARCRPPLPSPSLLFPSLIPSRFLARFYFFFLHFTFFYFYLCYNLARKWRRNHKITL